MVIEKAKRLGSTRHVLILLDTSPGCRAYQRDRAAERQDSPGGSTPPLHKPKRFFGAARNVERRRWINYCHGAHRHRVVRMDEVIFEEFKAREHEIHLDRKLTTGGFPSVTSTARERGRKSFCSSGGFEPDLDSAQTAGTPDPGGQHGIFAGQNQGPKIIKSFWRP